MRITVGEWRSYSSGRQFNLLWQAMRQNDVRLKKVHKKSCLIVGPIKTARKISISKL